MRGFAFALGSVVVLAAVGCGEKKANVFGRVTLDGKPIDNGTMQFFPVDMNAPTAAAVVGADGTYRTEAAPTKMKVLIHSNRIIGKRKMYDDQPNSPTVDIAEELLPARYTDQKKTELVVDLVPGDNEKNFDLTSDKGPKEKQTGTGVH